MSGVIEYRHAPSWSAVLAERERQIVQEGWTAEHDAQHDGGELLQAASFYFRNATDPHPLPIRGADGAPLGWPWHADWWKPQSRWRDLVRAGALCLAERDRLRRRNQDAYIGHVDHKLCLILFALDKVPEGERQ